MRIESELREVPVTCERPVPQDIQDVIEKPGVARATEAPDIHHPHGTRNHPSSRSVLQQHIDFFDRDKNGVVTPWETVEGLRIIGFNIFSSLFIAFVIHVFMSLPTAEPWLGIFPFDPLFRIWTKNIHKGKHGSDSGTFDTEGRFIPQKFEEVFTKWGTDKERMSLSELYQMTSDLSVAMDPFGWFAAKFEWGVLWWLCADDDWMVSRECIRSALDGSLFYILEEEQNRCKLE